MRTDGFAGGLLCPGSIPELLAAACLRLLLASIVCAWPDDCPPAGLLASVNYLLSCAADQVFHGRDIQQFDVLSGEVDPALFFEFTQVAADHLTRGSQLKGQFTV